MGKLKLEEKDVRRTFKFHMNRDMNPFWSMGSFLKEELRYHIDFDVYLPTKGMNLQRPLVWTLFQKQQLILSVLKELPIPKISVIQQTFEKDKGKIVFEIIDGKQRLSTMISYLKNEFPIEVNGIEYLFDELSDRLRGDLRTFSPRGDVAYSYDDKPISDADKIAWFEMINFAGTPQDIQHLNLLKQ